MKSGEKIALYKEQWNELKKRYPSRKERANYTPVPGEETVGELSERIKKAMTCISGVTPDKGKVAVFSHGKATKAFIADLEDKELDEIDIPNCGIVEILYNSENSAHPFSVQAYL